MSSKRIIGIIPLFLLLFSFGCQHQSATTATAKPITKQTLPSSQMNIESDLQATLQNAQGQHATVYLVASDEQIQKTSVPSCSANQGDIMRSGHYSFYLQTNPAQKPQKQTIAPFGQEILEFNEARPQMIQRVPAPNKTGADLLLVHQTAGCNGDEVAVFALSPDGKKLVPLRFHSTIGTNSTVFASDIQRINESTLKTTSYDNSTSRYTATHWNIDFEHERLIQENVAYTKLN